MDASEIVASKAQQQRTIPALSTAQHRISAQISIHETLSQIEKANKCVQLINHPNP